MEQGRPQFSSMSKPAKSRPHSDVPKPRRRDDKREAKSNKRLAEQTRKLLAKHYASKYLAR